MGGKINLCYLTIMYNLVEENSCRVCGSMMPGGAATCPGCGCSLQGANPAHYRSSTASSSLLWPIWVSLVGIALLALGLYAFVTIRLIQTPCYKESVAIAEASAGVQKVLGSDIHTVLWPAGFPQGLQDPEFAQWSISLSGTRGSGHLDGVANQANGSWEFSRLEFVSNDGKTRLDLTPAGRRLQLPPVPEKKVFLIPIGLSNDVSLDWAPAYYKAKFGIDVTVLPPAPWQASLVDPERHQLNSEKCVEYLSQVHPELGNDPFSIIVGITSYDMYIPEFGWKFAENLREGHHLAVVSSARLRPPSFFGRRNPEWLDSRLQKLISKNLAILYFDLPMSSDYTSLLSGGILSGMEFDEMGGQIVGADARWNPFLNPGEPFVSVYDIPGKSDLWELADGIERAVPDTAAELFTTDLTLGIFVQWKVDFILDGQFPLQLTRVYRNQDDRSREFGIGGSDSLDVFLVGRMGSYIELIQPDGARVHFDIQRGQGGPGRQLYRENGRSGGDFAKAVAVFAGDTWTVKRTDGWTFYFPFRPKALEQNVTVLTSYEDPAGHRYVMQRDSFGDLESITTPGGAWLRFESDTAHRIRNITSSSGRTMQYQYDARGRLIRASDSEGHVDLYTYDDKGEMLTVAHGSDPPILINTYGGGGFIKSEALADGRKFEYSYAIGPRNIIYRSVVKEPNGLETDFDYGPIGYIQSLPTPRPF